MKSGAEAKRDGSPMAGGQTGAGDGIQTAQRTEVPHQCEQRPSRDLSAQIAVNTISPLFGQTHRLDTLLQHALNCWRAIRTARTAARRARIRSCIAYWAACRADVDIEDVVLTTEEEGIGLIAGGRLGGKRGVLLMQSSGVGNCLNTFSLQMIARFPQSRARTSELRCSPFTTSLQARRSREAILQVAGFGVQACPQTG